MSASSKAEDMRSNPRWALRPASLTFLTVVFVLILGGLLFPLRETLDDNRNILAAAASVATILGVLALVPAFLAYLSNAEIQGEQSEENSKRIAAELEGERLRVQREMELERVRLSVDLLSKFYDNASLDEIRRLLRTPKADYKLPDSPGDDLRDDEVRMMNFFEALSVAVEKEVIDPDLLNRLLGCPIREITIHPVAQRLMKPEYSYEGFVNVLVPALVPFWREQGSKFREKADEPEHT